MPGPSRPIQGWKSQIDASQRSDHTRKAQTEASTTACAYRISSRGLLKIHKRLRTGAASFKSLYLKRPPDSVLATNHRVGASDTAQRLKGIYPAWSNVRLGDYAARWIAGPWPIFQYRIHRDRAVYGRNDTAPLQAYWTNVKIGEYAIQTVMKRPIGKCKLCLQTRELQDSHLMPASLYRKARLDGDRNPNPTMLTAKGRVQTSQPIKDYVLCRDCEQLFNKNGERYTMAQVTQKGGRSFPLLQTLLSCTPTKEAYGFTYYDENVSPTIERNKLGYFALSVFWRAGIHTWHRPFGGDNQIHLGEHEEPLRLYLLEMASFPAKMMLYFVVCSDPYSQNRFCTPSKSSHPGNTTTHEFQARGLNFLLMTGDDITETMGTLCLMTGKDRWIMVRSCQDMMAGAEMGLEMRAEIAKLTRSSRNGVQS